MPKLSPEESSIRGKGDEEMKSIRGSVLMVQDGGDVHNLVRSIDVVDFKIHDDVRVTPSYIEFKDACEGMTFRQLLTIQNIGMNPAVVRIGSPNSIAFRMKTLEHGALLSPGLRILRWVNYSYKRLSVLHAIIPITINETTFGYQVICSLATECITIEPKSIDFGIVDIGCSSGVKLLKVENIGGKSTRFAVDLGPNDLELTVKPMKALVKPRSRVNLKVELIGTSEGTFMSEFWIKSSPNLRVPIKVNIIIPKLVVYHPNTTGDFTLIDFPPTFTETERHDTFVLRNLSSQISNFVVLGEIENELIPIQAIDTKKNSAYRVFKIHPMEGRMGPFEGLVFTILFLPTAKIECQDFMAFVRILRVHCTEVEDILRPNDAMDDHPEEAVHKIHILDADAVSSESSEDTSSEQHMTETVRLCLHGETEVAQLKFVPDELHLGDILLAESVKREVTVRNHSKNTPVGFQFISNVAAHCLPPEGWLKPNGSIQVLMTVTSKLNAESPFKLVFDVVIGSCGTGKQGIEFIKSKPCWLLCWMNTVVPIQKKAKTKFTLGITPHLTNEVGENIERATFGSNIKKPRQAMLLVERDPNKYWAHKSLIRANGFPDSIPAFPNDTQRSLRRWTGGDVRTIFTGTLRYSPGPDHEDTLTPEMLLLKTYQRVYWSKYLRTIKNQTERNAVRKSLLLDFENNEEPEDFCHVLDIPKLDRRSVARRMVRRAMSSKPVIKGKDEMLVPLSPLQIYNVKVFPTIFTYGTVAPKSINYRRLNIENRNTFPVMVRLVALVSKCISFPEGSVMILQPGTLTTKLIEYQAAYVGKFNTYIDYMINDNHSFELTITADVVYKTLSLGVREIVFGTQFLPEEAYRPYSTYVEIKNKLDATSSFTWDVPASASFDVNPISGFVRGLRTLYVEVLYEPVPSKTHVSEIVLDSEGGTYVTLNLSTILTMPDVVFINDTLNLDRIPLNMQTTAIGVLHNAEFNEVMFEVDRESLLYGCEVYPRQGIISPRGIVALEVRLKFDACIKFAISIQVMVQKCLFLQLKVIGQVSFPMLKLSPDSIQMRRISADAFATHLILATNIGKSVLKVQFLLDEYPEYRASLSPSRGDPGLGREGFTVLPGVTQPFYLHFIPIDMASYAFFLPIVLNEILGPVTTENPRTLKPEDYLESGESHYIDCPDIIICPLPPKLATIFIDCTVAGHVISFSKLIFHFDVLANELSDELRVFNEARQETSFIIRTDKFHEGDCPFSIRWAHGVKPSVTSISIVCTLYPGEETFFLIEFDPQEQGFFSLEAPIFIRGELEGSMFNNLLLDGDNPTGSIQSNIANVYFSPVPLDVDVERKITLTVKGFKDSAKLFAVVLSPDYCQGQYNEESIQVRFPGGNAINGKQRSEEMDVSISFKSDTSVSFKTKIEFHDDFSLALCIVNVYATADNCVLTTHSFLRSVRENQKIHKPETQLSSKSLVSEDEDDVSLLKQPVNSLLNRDDTLGSLISSDEASIVSRNPSKSFISYSLDKMKQYQNENEKDIEECEEEEEEEKSTLSKLTLPDPRPKVTRPSKTMYPYFPSSTKGLDYDCDMRRTLQAAEEWLYTGPLKFNFYPSIIDGITGVLSDVCSIKATFSDRRRTHTVNQSFIDILIALAGPIVSKYIGDTSTLPGEDTERVAYVMKLYKNALEFLTKQGACLPHVTPKFLLSYSDYLLIAEPIGFPTMSSTSGTLLNEQMPREEFESLSKQCWLDMTLQTFKVLVLSRISVQSLQDRIINTLSKRSADVTRATSAQSLINVFTETSLTHIAGHPVDTSMYSLPEKILMGWLTHHYEHQRAEGWMVDKRDILNPQEQREVLEARVVGNFENDLADALVLISVTASYCPYLVEDCFQNIYICPVSPEEMNHNAICLVTAWRKIRLGFMITPAQITRPHCVQMVMLVTHLFETLPSLLPKAKIKFSCGLTETVTRQISFTNSTTVPIGYVVQFINNGPGYFTAVHPEAILYLNPHDSGHLVIQFHARKIQKTKAHVVLCGASIAPHFAKNQTFTLEGSVNQLGVTNNYNIESRLYEVHDEILSIPVPYVDPAEYEIYMTEKEPTKPALLDMTKWSELRLRKVPRRLFLNQVALYALDQTQQASLSITVACIAPDPRTFWLVFEAKMGDFIIQINSFSKKTITERITVEWDREECTCPDPPAIICSTCPLNIEIMIPLRNTQLWNCISLMFQKTLNVKERLFWSRHLDTNIGLRLIHWLMGEHNDSAAQECNHIFNTSVTYAVTTPNKGSPLTIPTEFTIPDVRPRDELIVMSIHILQSTPQVYEATLWLISPDNKEHRSYKADFLCKTPASLPKAPKPLKKKRRR